MLVEIDRELQKIDSKIDAVADEQLHKLFSGIPLEIFGQIQVDRPDRYSQVMERLPVMPEDQVQINWTGSAGHVLMKQSISFIELVVTAYHAYSGKSLSDANVLDFGCGWGRLIRLLYKYVPAQNIYGVDPWDLSIDICKA